MVRTASVLFSAVLIAASLTGAPPAFAADDDPAEVDGQRKYAVYQLGDSYSAGNGAGDYYGDPQARRSHNNYAEVYSQWLGTHAGMHVTYQSFAHSGAVSNGATADATDGGDLLNDQVGSVGTDADLVMFTIGGNDVAFQDIVKQCFVVAVRSADGCRTAVTNAEALLPTVGQNTTLIFEALAERMKPGAEIMLVGYPQLSTDTDYTLCDWAWICSWGSYDAAAGVRALGDKARAMQEGVVRAWNDQDPQHPGIFVSGVADRFAGHEPEPHVGQSNAVRWVNEFFQTETIQPDPRQSSSSSFSADKLNWYHPGTVGHFWVAQQIEDEVGLSPHARSIIWANGWDPDDPDNANIGDGDFTGPMGAKSVPPTVSAVAQGPEAWLNGPYVRAVGESIELDARGSVPSMGRGLAYEWDVDGDGIFEVSSGGNRRAVTFDAPFDGLVSVRVTQEDGQTDTASTRVQVTVDGDAAGADDNCPDIENASQSDEDGDGIGDECDPDAVAPAADRPGVRVGDGTTFGRVGDDPLSDGAVPAGTATVTTSVTELAAGEVVTVHAEGLAPGAEASFGLGSVPAPLASALVAPDGTASASFTVPVGVTPGADHAVAAARGAFGTVPLQVREGASGAVPSPTPTASTTPTPAPEPSAQPTAAAVAGGRSSLPATGAPDAWGGVGLAATLLLLAAAVTWGRRRSDAAR